MPSKEKKHDLYIATSMAELQKKSEVKPGTTNARILVKSADTMFREAEKHDLLQDEERAFIMYMRYFNIVKQVKSSPDYKKNKEFFDSLIGKKNQVRAIEQAEKLAESLKERYDFKEAEAVAQKFAALEASGQRKEKEAEEAEEKEKAKDKNKTAANKDNKTASKGEAKDQPSTSTEAPQAKITPTPLCNLLRDSNTQLIIMDARPAADFTASHINHKSCISVPQESLSPGTTVTNIEGQLPAESLPLWQKRGQVDHIIMLDWSSRFQSLVIGSPLRTLKDALFVYDSTVIMKSEPLILDGGYDQWLLFYPTLTTSSHVSRPSVPSASSALGLLDFDYPEFEEQPPDTLSKVDGLTNIDGAQTTTTTTAATPAQDNTTTNNTIPQFNRALKPKSGSIGSDIAAVASKPDKLNNASAMNGNVLAQAQEAIAGEGASSANQLYPSFSVAPSSRGEKGERTLEEPIARERTSPPPPPLTPTPTLPAASASVSVSQEEAQAAAKLKTLEEKRKKEERALADIMRQKRHMEQDLKEMQKLAQQEKMAQEAHDKAVREEDAERKRQAEVERLRQERKRKEAEAQRDRDQQATIKAKERELQKARERAEKDMERLRQDRGEKDRQEEEMKRQREKDEQARLQAERDASALAAATAAARKAEEEKRKREEERKRKEQEEERAKEEEKRKREKARREEEEKKKKQQEKESEVDVPRQAQVPKMIPSPSLPAGWEKRLDNATRRYYYIDHKRGTTQWEPPQLMEQPAKRKDTYTAKLKDEPMVSRKGLTRSHSSPDIMKQMADEARMAGLTNTPVFDRTSKPSLAQAQEKETPTVNVKPPVQRQLARRRDLNPMYGNVGPAMTGLRNLGNTCYMNSTVQCLNNTTPLVSYLLNDSYLADINRDSVQGMHGEVVDEFAVVVKALWSGQYRCITPRDLKNTVGKYNPMFAGYEQQDSQEFLTFLLDGLHEGLNEVKKRPHIPDQENDRLPDEKAAAIAWENHKKLHRSIVVELFQGQLKSTLMCRTCHKKSVTFQAFMYISLPIPASNKCSLRDCFRAFLQPEMMTGSCKWKCPKCRVERDAEKKIDIWKLPPILLIGLNRFVSDGMWMQKKTTYVDFPVDDLDLEEFTMGIRNRSRYNLYGVSNHYGTMEGGHYTAFCRNPCNSKWHKFDDQEVYEMSKSDVKTSAAFVLYYSSIPLNAPHFKPHL